MASNQDRVIVMDDLPAQTLKTLSGSKSSRLGFASQYLKDVDFVQAAFAAGINYFFSYNLPSDQLLGGLKPLLSDHRDTILIATGSESRDPNMLRHDLNQVRRSLGTDIIDAFFIEYLSPQDSAKEVETVLNVLQRWKTEGWIRYVGASTHSRETALELIDQDGWDVLMLRYNMAHRKAEEQVLPAAQSAGLPVIAFTCTRWGSLLNGHSQWHKPTPTAADCYRYALDHPAVQVALTAPATMSQLQSNLSVLNAPPLAKTEIEHWQDYGDMVYGSGQDAFETQWV